MKIKHILVVALLIIIAGTQTVQAADNLPPIAIANFDGIYNMGIGYVDEPVTFDGSNSYDSDGTIVSYTWDFGDNTSGTGMTPSHTYTMPGNYSVALTVTDDGVPALSDTGFTTAEIIIRNQPPVADAGGPYAGYAGEPITFDGSGSYDPDGTIVLYMWYFDGKGPYMGVTQTYTFTEPGIYTVSLYVSDDGGPFFDLYDVDAITVEILPQNQPPLAYAGGPYTGYAGEPIQFNGSGSSDSDGTIVSYQWSFGDNTTGVGIIPEHTYTTAGTYTVNLLVTDNEGAIDADNTTAEILILPQTQPPLADAAGPYTSYAGEPIQFNGSGSSDSDGTIVSYQWSFGDKSTGVGIMPEHTYTIAGTYTVNLLVTDNEGAIGADNTTAEIIVRPPPVDLDITGLHVTKRISLSKVKPVTIRMAVMNNGMGNEPRIANVVGMQNGVEVYNVNMPVSSDVGVSTTWVFPAYTPTVIGTITWTATINDDYPDIDKAVSTTKVAK